MRHWERASGKLALPLTGDILNIMSMTGVMIRFGLATGSATLLMDNAHEARRDGTTLAMIIGLSTIALVAGD